MGVHHLISVDEDQFRNWQGDEDDLFRNIGTAVVLACLDPDKSTVSITDDGSGAAMETRQPTVTIKHVIEYEGDDIAVWVWSAEDSLCIADLPDADLQLLSELVSAIQRQRGSQ